MGKFKKLFSKEEIIFDDLCETKSVTSTLYLDKNEDLSDGGHNYIFVGKVGRFCPVKPGSGGALLMREKDGKYYAATGTKGYRWKEAEVVKSLGLEEQIDRSYYDRLVDKAVEALVVYGDYSWFVSDDPYVGPEFVDGKPVYSEEMPFLTVTELAERFVEKGA